MTKKDYSIARELKKVLGSQIPLLDFRVFGSRARGDADSSSDMDVFIEVETLSPATKERIHDLTWEVGFQHLMVISPLIISRHELEETALRSSSIIRSIHREGIRV